LAASRPSKGPCIDGKGHNTVYGLVKSQESRNVSNRMAIRNKERDRERSKDAKAKASGSGYGVKVRGEAEYHERDNERERDYHAEAGSRGDYQTTYNATVTQLYCTKCMLSIVSKV